ncbi:unnamed protein product, partial [Amoebophrya sp. A120]|eukprot:GSA120T00008509001.1
MRALASGCRAARLSAKTVATARQAVPAPAVGHSIGGVVQLTSEVLHLGRLCRRSDVSGAVGVWWRRLLLAERGEKVEIVDAGGGEVPLFIGDEITRGAKNYPAAVLYTAAPARRSHTLAWFWLAPVPSLHASTRARTPRAARREARKRAGGRRIFTRAPQGAPHR